MSEHHYFCSNTSSPRTYIMPLYVLTHYGCVCVPITATQILLTRRYTTVSFQAPLMWQLYRHLCGSYTAIVTLRDTFPFTTTAQTLYNYYACHSSIHYRGSIVRELLFLFLFTFHLISSLASCSTHCLTYRHPPATRRNTDASPIYDRH